MANSIVTIDWPSLKSGSMLTMKDFPCIKLTKLDNNKALYYGLNENATLLVDIKIYCSEEHGEYYYFSIGPNDWHPLTTRLWNIPTS